MFSLPPVCESVVGEDDVDGNECAEYYTYKYILCYFVPPF